MGQSRKYLIASCDQSLKRMGLDYVDIFYSHRFDPDTPLEETMGALDHIVRSGRALYVGISCYNSATHARGGGDPEGPRHALRDPPAQLQHPEPLGRTDGLKDTLKELGIGSIAFTPLAQGILTRKYLNGIPQGSRAAQGKSLDPAIITESAPSTRSARWMRWPQTRGQTLAQMALAWVLRDGGITTALIGASKPEQVIDCAGAIGNLDFTADELAQIDRIAEEKDVNLWAKSSETD